MTADIYGLPITEPAAWTAQDLLGEDTWVRAFGEDDLIEFDRALHSVRTLSTTEIRPDNFLLPHFAEVLGLVAEELELGRGVALLRGLPVHSRYTEEQAGRIYWGVASYLGTICPQNVQGDLLDSVAYDPQQVGGARGYYSKRANDLHCDPTDILGLLSLKQAKVGGFSLLASSLAHHNVMRIERPDLLAELYEPMAMDWMGEEPPGSPRYYMAPIFRYARGQVSCRNITRGVRRAQRLPEVPRLNASQVEALYFMEGIGYRPELHVEYLLEPGDMQFVNNHVVSHGRSSFEDDPQDPMKQRRLLRLWIMAPHWARSDGTSYYDR